MMNENGRALELLRTRRPIEGLFFKVDYLTINKSLFLKKRIDQKQEWVRNIILEAFDIAEKDPEIYCKTFYTLMPKNKWYPGSASLKEIEQSAIKFGDHMANWVEQALEWAQRITNCDSWDDICNLKDTARWYRLICWKDGKARPIGGSCDDVTHIPPSDVDLYDYDEDYRLYNTIPLVVVYEV